MKEETKKKISENSARYWLGKHLPQHVRENTRKIMLERWCDPDYRRKMSASHIGKNCGEKHWNWQGGKSYVYISRYVRKTNLEKYFTKERRIMNRKPQQTQVPGYSTYYMRIWRANNPEKARFQRHMYKMRKKNAQGTHTLQEWLELKVFYNYMCLRCKKFEPEIKLTEDHIIPLSYGGSDTIDNIQPLCSTCNTSKYTKIISYLPLGSNDQIYEGKGSDKQT